MTAKDDQSGDPLEVLKRRNADIDLRWVLHYCGMCGYPCGYFWDPTYQNEDGSLGSVRYDNGCDCVTYHRVRAGPQVESEFRRMMEQPVVLEKFLAGVNLE